MQQWRGCIPYFIKTLIRSHQLYKSVHNTEKKRKKKTKKKLFLHTVSIGKNKLVTTVRVWRPYPSSQSTPCSLIYFTLKRWILKLVSNKHPQIILTPEHGGKVSWIHMSVPVQFPSSFASRQLSLGVASLCMIPWAQIFSEYQNNPQYTSGLKDWKIYNFNP